MARVVIAGAGIFGVTAALELLQRGWDVLLTDPGPIPHPDASSTDISKVLRMDYGDDPFYLDLMEEAFAGWDAWNSRWEAPLYHQTGVLMLSQAEMRPGGYTHDSYMHLRARGYPLERVDRSFFRERFPAWNADLYRDGYFNPRGGWAESGRVVAQVQQEYLRQGGTVQEGVRCAGWLEDGGRVTAMKTAGGEAIPCDVLVLAAGSWTPSLHPGLRDVMWPTAQDVIHFRVPDPALFRPPHFSVYTADVAETGWYGFPALADGTLKLAHHGPGRRIDPAAPRHVDGSSEARFRQFLADNFPGLGAVPKIFERVCFYADTFDGDFWIGRDPERDGLVVASGGSGHAFKFAPVLGPIIADAVEGRPNPAAARFAWRKPGPQKTEFARYDGD